jgi:hypothetical protein
MSDELDVQMKLNLDLQNQQKRVFNDPHTINPYKQVFLMYEERMMQISRIQDSGVKATFAKPNKKFRDFNSLKEQRKTHIRMFRELPTVMPSEIVNKEKEYLTPDRYSFFNPRKKTNSFDLDLIWNEKTSYIDEKLRCLAALMDKPNTYILSVVYQDPFALNVFDIDIGLGGKYTSVKELLLQKSKLDFKPTRVANEINTNSFLIPAADLQKATSMMDYMIPSGKDNISACVFGTLDEILDLCDVASTDEPAVVGFAAAPIEEVLRILELYITNEGKFSKFLTYKTVTTPRLRLQPQQINEIETDLNTAMMKEKRQIKVQPRLKAVEFDENINDPSFEDLETKMQPETSCDFVRDFDTFMNSSATMTFPFSPSHFAPPINDTEHF